MKCCMKGNLPLVQNGHDLEKINSFLGYSRLDLIGKMRTEVSKKQLVDG